MKRPTPVLLAAGCLLSFLTVSGFGMTDPHLVQNRYRWRLDDGSESNATWMAAENEAVTNMGWYSTIRLRFAVAETGGFSPGSLNATLEYASRTNGPWTRVSDGNLTAFTLAATPHYESGDPTTAQLAGTGTFAPGCCIETPYLTTVETVISNTHYSEFEWCIQPMAKADGGADYFFRMVDLDEYAVYPRLTMAPGSAEEPPSWSTSVAATGNVNRPFTHVLRAAGSEPITYGASGLPPDVAFDGTNLLSGIPWDAGTYPAVLTASNAFGACTQSLTLVVEPRGDGEAMYLSRDTTLTGDVAIAYGHGIVVSADNITIDGGGHALVRTNAVAPQDPSACGIFNPGFTNVTIRNFALIQGFEHGINLVNAPGSAVHNCRLEGNGITGIRAFCDASAPDRDGLAVLNNTVKSPNICLEITGVKSGAIEGNTLRGGRIGVLVGDASHGPFASFSANRLDHQAELTTLLRSVGGRQLFSLELERRTGQVGEAIGFEMELFDIENAAAPSSTYTLRTLPPEPVTATQDAHRVTGHFTPTRPGLYSLVAEVEDADGNRATRVARAWVGPTEARTVTYYWTDQHPTHGQPVNLEGYDFGAMHGDLPADIGFRKCSIWVQASPDTLPALPAALITGADCGLMMSFAVTQQALDDPEHFQTFYYLGLARSPIDLHINVSKKTYLPLEWGWLSGDDSDPVWREISVTNVNWAMDYPVEWYHLCAYFAGTQPYVRTGDPANPSHVAFRCRVTTSPDVSAITNPDLILLAATSEAADPGGGCLTLTGDEDGEVHLANFRRPILGAATTISPTSEARFATGMLDGEQTFASVPMEVVPAGDPVTVQVDAWTAGPEDTRQWTESSAGNPGGVQHTIAGLEPGKRFFVTADENVLCTVTAAAPGTLTFSYAGAFPVTLAVSADHDADGIPDNLDPDDDNDGMSDGDEAVAGTDPLDAGSLLVIGQLSFGGDSLSLFFDSVTGRLYDVLYKDDLLGTNDWLPLTNDWPGDGGVMIFEDAGSATQSFYRIRVTLP